MLLAGELTLGQSTGKGPADPPSPAVRGLRAEAARVVRCGLSTCTFRWRGGPWGRELGDRGKELQMHSRCGLRNFSIPKPKSLAPNVVSPRPPSHANAWAAAGRAGGSGSWLLRPSSHPSLPSLGMVAAAGDVACTLVTRALVGPGMTKQCGKQPRDGLRVAGVLWCWHSLLGRGFPCALLLWTKPCHPPGQDSIRVLGLLVSLPREKLARSHRRSFWVEAEHDSS